MKKKPIRFGILGTGDGARNHLRAFDFVDEEIAVLRSVCGRDPERTRAFAMGDSYEIEDVYTDEATFLADEELDAVIIATPDALHVPHALAAMRAGKHVLVENPMGLSVGDAEELRVAQIFRPDIRLGVGFHLRHHAGHRMLRDVLARGAIIGWASHIYLEWTTRSMGADNWRAVSREGWFALAALGSHALDLVGWLVGADRANVFATKSATATGRDGRVTLHVDCDRGVTASILVSVEASPTKYLRISGSDGVIECRDTLGGRGAGKIILPNDELLAFDPVNPYASQIVEFATAVREDRNPEADVKAGLRNVDWLVQAGDSMNAHVIKK